MKSVSRNLSSKINYLLELFPAVLVIGSRQTGKTTLAKMTRPEWKYFDLEKPSDYDLITQDFEFFFSTHSQELIFDEAQISPDLFKVMRGIIDADRDRKNRFLLTGSSSPELLKNASESLAGRIAIVEMGTLKLNEYLGQPLPIFYECFSRPITRDSFMPILSEDVKVTLEEYLEFFLKGGYPEPSFVKDPNFHSIWMDNYIQSYIDRDIRSLFPRLDIIKYRRFISMLADLSGTIVNRSDVGRSLDSTEKSIKEYLAIAGGTFLWRTVSSFERSKAKSIVKMPRGNFRDSGITHYLSNVFTMDQLLKYPKVGNSFEAHICEELIKGVQATIPGKCEYFFYRTRNGAEVDLILSGPFGVLPIEIKYGSNTTIRQLSSLKKFIADNSLPLGLVVNNCDKAHWISDSILVVPARLI